MNPRAVQIIAFVLAIALVGAASRFSPRINEGREYLNMYGPESPMENVPPEYAFAIQAFGAFRSLITDIVFIQAEEYKSQGRYYDAMQLHTWICKLQPRFPTVWEYCSWNMAWNISVTTYTPEERWNWIYNGARLVRDEGLRYNPRAVNLYKQLAWIFNNKMSETIDEFHMTYKRNWAWRMHLLLGPPPDPLGDQELAEQMKNLTIDPQEDPLRKAAEQIQQLRRETGVVTEEELAHRRAGEERPGADGSGAEAPLTPLEIVKRAHYQRIQQIDEAPATLDALYAQFPAARAMVTQLRALGVPLSEDELTEETYWQEGGLADTFFRRYRRLVDAPSLVERVRKDVAPDPDAEATARFGEILQVREQDPAGLALVRCLQRRVLKEVYKLETDHMLYLIRRFGPIDWRSVDSQSLYWVTRGIIAGGETLDNFANDKTNTTRILFFSLRNLFLRGEITFEPYPPAIHLSYINLAPDINFIGAMHGAFIDYGPLIDPDPGAAGTAGETFRNGHINFLSESVRLLWLADRQAEAQKYYDYLRTHYGRSDDGSLKRDYMLPLEQFVKRGLAQNLDSQREATNAVNGLLATAYDRLAGGKVREYNNYRRESLEVYEAYMKDKETVDKLAMPSFFDMEIDLLRNLLAIPAISDVMAFNKIRLWNVLPINYRQRVYDDLIAGLTAECEYFKLDVRKAFPEPPGMEEFRKTHKRRGGEKEEDNVETPAQPRG